MLCARTFALAAEELHHVVEQADTQDATAFKSRFFQDQCALIFIAAGHNQLSLLVRHDGNRQCIGATPDFAVQPDFAPAAVAASTCSGRSSKKPTARNQMQRGWARR